MLSHSSRASITKRVSVWLLLCLVLAVTTHAAKPYVPKPADALTDEWRWTQFNELKGRGLKCLEEGADGSMWFGISAGALRYDGLNWTEFSDDAGLSSPVNSLAKTDSNLFAATKSSILVFKEDRWEKVFPLDSAFPWLVEGISVAPNGGLWAATNWGAIHLQSRAETVRGKHDTSVFLYTCRDIASIKTLVDELDSVFVIDEAPTQPWTVTSGAVLDASSRPVGTIMAVAQNGPAAKAGLRVGDRIVSVNEDESTSNFNSLLNSDVGTELQIEFLRPPLAESQKLTLTCEETDGDYASFHPESIVEDRLGTIWFATKDGILISAVRGDDHKLQWVNQTREHTLPRLPSPRITATRSGIAAVSTSSTGGTLETEPLLEFDGRQWKSTPLRFFRNASITSIRDNRLLVGFSRGFIKVDGERTRMISLKRLGIIENSTYMKQVSDDSIWAAGKSGIALRNQRQGDRWTSYDDIVFLADGSDGSEWFLSKQLTVVRKQNDAWTEYSADDGMMTVPTNVLVTKTGKIWVGGSHNGVAATANLRDGKWVRKLHPELSWCIDRRSMFEDRDGRVWFGAAGHIPPDKGFLGGAIRYDNQQWKHIVPTRKPAGVRGITQTNDGSIWFGGPTVFQILPDDSLGDISHIRQQLRSECTAILGDNRDRLWLGTSRGLLECTTKDDRSVWHSDANGLSHRNVRNLSAMPDGTIVVNTAYGFDRYDGRNWSKMPIQKDLALLVWFGGARVSTDGSLWFGQTWLSKIRYENVVRKVPEDNSRVWCVRYRPDTEAPETHIVSANSQVPLGETATITLRGVDPWNVTSAADLSFSWRVDQGEWSPFVQSTRAQVNGLRAGNHLIQIRARDADFNVDASPAEVRFQVILPVWKRGWFQLLMLIGVVLGSVTVVQTIRVFWREATLRTANAQLSKAEKELQVINAELETRVQKRTTELNQSELRYRSIVQDQTEYIVRFDAHGNVEFANDAFMRANRTSDNGSGSCTVRNLSAATRQRLRDQVSGLDATDATRDRVIRIERADGPADWEEWNSRAIVDSSGKITGYQSIGRNVTELREAESRLHEKETQLAHIARVSALGEMVAEISHEINQPLATIANFSSAAMFVLEKDDTSFDERESLRNWTKRIADQTQRIHRIIQSLRRFGRAGSKRESFNIREAVNEALVMTNNRTRHAVDHLSVDCPMALPAVKADRVQIEQVLVNLIRNACDAMQQTPEGQRELKIEATIQDSNLMVVVTDSGPGVPQEISGKIFDTFKTTKTDGMGIGLAISRSIIEAHGGVIRAVADQSHGRFEFLLPLDEPINT